MLLKTFEVHVNSTASDSELEAVLEKLEDIDIASIAKNRLPDELAKLIV